MRELPMLAGIASLLRWLEELVTILSGPVLTAGLAIALVDLLTDGQLLTSQPELLYVWAISQALGVDGQLIGASVRAGRAARSGHYWRVVAHLALIGALGYVAYLASDVFATQQALGLSTAQSLARLGMDSTRWIVTRSALAVVLVILSGLLRYDAPDAGTAALTERERLGRELELEPLRAQLRIRKAHGWRDVAAAMVRSGTIPGTIPETIPETIPPEIPDDVPPDPPDDSRPATGNDLSERFPLGPSLALLPRATGRSRAHAGMMRRNDSLRIAAEALLMSNPAMTRADLRHALHCRQETANGFWVAAQRFRKHGSR